MAKSRKSKQIKASSKPIIQSDKDVQITSANNYYISRSARWFTICLFIVIAFILYHRSLQFGYVLDDTMVIVENNHTKQGFAGISKILTTDSFQGYFGEQKDLLVGGRYRPLSLVTFAIEHQFFGLKPAISHAINIFLYGLSAACLFFCFLRLFQERLDKENWIICLSFLTAILFLVHPIHTEAVANIKGRDEIMAFIFSMLSLNFAVRYVDHKKIGSLLIMLICYFLGVLSKENVLTFMGIIPLAIILFRPKFTKAFWMVFVGLLASTLIYLAIRYQIIGYLIGSQEVKDIMNNPFVDMSANQKYPTILYTLLVYFKLAFIPHPLTHDYYPFHIPTMDWTNIKVWLSVALHLGLIIYAFTQRKKRPAISFAIGFYLMALSIVSNLVVGVGTFMNERFAFMATAGTCLLLAYLVRLSPNGNRLLSKALLTGIIIVYSALTLFRVPVWENALTLNEAAIKVSVNSARANSFMGTALFNQYKETQDFNQKRALLNQADIYVSKAVNLLPNYGNANLMKAGIAAEKHKMDGNINALLSAFKEVIKVKPSIGFVSEYLEYINLRNNPKIMIAFYLDVSNTLVNQNKPTWAIHYLNFAYGLDSSHPQVKQRLASAYTAIGNPQEAQKYMQ